MKEKAVNKVRSEVNNSSNYIFEKEKKLHRKKNMTFKKDERSSAKESQRGSWRNSHYCPPRLVRITKRHLHRDKKNYEEGAAGESKKLAETKEEGKNSAEMKPYSPTAPLIEWGRQPLFSEKL